MSLLNKNKFKLLTEILSDKTVKLDAYKSTIDYYNSNKTKFITMLRASDNMSDDAIDEKAKEIIKGNPYLNMQYKIDKVIYQIERSTKRLSSNDVSDLEKKSIQENIATSNKQLNELKAELNKKIKDDLSDINND